MAALVRRGFAIALSGLLLLAAAFVPMLKPPEPAPGAAPAIPWPTLYEGRKIARLPAAREDAFLSRLFPGQIARFSDGRRQIVLRRVGMATRLLHPASDCFRALGYAVEPAPMRLAPDGAPASCSIATRGGVSLRICEQVRDGRARSWPDISSWYWSALLGTSDGPWLAAMTVERTR